MKEIGKLQGKVFVTSDLHFFDKRILKSANRPFKDVSEMNDALIHNWNSVVSNSDSIICIGDFSLGTKEQLFDVVEHLQGNIYLVKGNHDKFSNQTYIDAGIRDVFDNHASINNIILSHKPKKPKKGTAIIFGHVHDSPYYKDIYHDAACCCIEKWGYKPVELELLVDYMENAPTNDVISKSIIKDPFHGKITPKKHS